MERENGNGNKVLLTVIGAATLLVAMVGATFAYFSATSNKPSVEVHTGSSSLTLTSSSDHVTGIRPTTFTDNTTADSDANVAKIELTISGENTSEGTYDITMTPKRLSIPATPSQGDISDLMYAVYKDNTQKQAATSFTDQSSAITIVDDEHYDSGEISGTYYVYVWIDNKNSEQNNFQNLDFDLEFTATTQSAL